MVDEPNPKPVDGEEILREIQELKNQIQEVAKTGQQTSQPGFFSSGLFFILLGLGLLTVAFFGLGSVHTTFSFVLVVLGVAILLYGTGTQGMGRFESDANSAKYNVALAGGAGVLSFCVAVGIIHYYQPMKLAFDIQRKYVIAIVKPSGDGSSTFTNYTGEFSIEGLAVPAMRRGNIMLIYVPFLESQTDKVQRVSYTLRLQDVVNRNPLLVPALSSEFEVAMDKAKSGNGGYDFPVFQVDPIDMRSTAAPVVNQQSAISAESADLRNLKRDPRASAPRDTAPAALDPQ